MVAPRGPRDRYAEPRISSRDLGRRGPVTSFTRLARTHLLSVAGDALFTIGLATTVFFNGDPNAPRPQVALYLLLTLAPFAIASPFIGPVLDRAAGGRRWMIFASALIRALLALLLISDLDSWTFYIEAFLMLVFSKVHLISKSALLPTTVRSDDELVEANSKLSLLGAIAAVVVGGPGLLMAQIGPQWVVGLSMVAFVATAVAALALPDTKVAPEPAGEAEINELRGVGILHALQAMSLVRFGVGFATFLILFSFRTDDRANVWYVVVALTAQAGFLAGSAFAPALRRRLVEERMLMAAMAATFVAAGASFFIGDLAGAALMSLALGMTSSVAKQGFDALVQRDAPDANRGRSFARFEARFQLVWVVGAFIPVVLPIPLVAGFAFLGGLAAYGLISYLVAYKRVQAVAAGRRTELVVPEPRWRKLWDLVRERRRAGPSAGRATAATDLGSGGVDPHDRTRVDRRRSDPSDPALEPTVATAATAPAGNDATRVVDGTDLLGPGLFGEPDVPVPGALLDAPADGLFAPDETWQSRPPRWAGEGEEEADPPPGDARAGDQPTGGARAGDTPSQPSLPGFEHLQPPG